MELYKATVNHKGQHQQLRCHEEQASATRSMNVNGINGYELQRPTSGRGNDRKYVIVRVVSKKTRSFKLAAYIISHQLYVISFLSQPNL